MTKYDRLLVLNDQGGGCMSITKNVTATLRAQEHGHQPIICAAAFKGGQGSNAGSIAFVEGGRQRLQRE